ncbi:MAG: ribonucleoside-diphosphate reductase, adenosylcobalamin-dependent [Chloroflexi bacterium RBG_13_56_8b]|nr:MAG: ribonucleoside-diphosphate reductase, adenosylcobalamin-dependent [Chloroflexi bacterium RBG_13_56_8b]
MNLSENALRVLEKRYLKKDKQGKVVETPEEMWHRVAEAIAAAELIYNPKADIKARENEFYQLMANLEFLPNSPTLMNAGRELGQLSACFVIPVGDSMESIFDAVKYTALIHKSGGGTGFSFSHLRPEGDFVKSTSGVASGPVSFMEVFDTTTDVTKQGGTRRGANMGILSVDHPDIMRFITAKEDPRKLTNFNISVAVTTEFMDAVKTGADYDLVNPRTQKVVDKLNAREVFDKIVDMAWRTGDPGVVFIDRINRDNPTPQLGKIESTNPCGEQPLLPYESCNLGSINLARMLKPAKGGYEIDYPKLAGTVRSAVRFLDNVIEVNKFPLPQIEDMTKKSRKIGLGVMGFADMLLMLGIPYNSEEALKVGTELMRFVHDEADRASVGLAEERGVFPAFPGSIHDVSGGAKMRNASCTTIAPTGTLSIIAGCSSGIEPLFALSYTRNILDGAQMLEVNPYFEQVARSEGFYSDELMKRLAEGAKLRDMEGIPDKIKPIFVTAHEITPEWHVKMQAAFQKSTDNAVSKTVNFPQEATREDITQVYQMAYEEGLKGITIYRDRSRDSQVLTTGKKEKVGDTTKLTPRKRPAETRGTVARVNTGCGSLYITVAYDDKGIFEVFATLGKSGGCASAQLEAICRLITLALRSGVDVASVVKQMKGIRCPSIAWEDGKSILSCADAIAGVLEKHIGADSGHGVDMVKNLDVALKSENGGHGADAVKNLAGQCPDCGNLLVYQEGCYICPSCGYTKC